MISTRHRKTDAGPKGRLLVAAAVAMLATLASACGGEEADSPAEPTEAADNEETPAADSTEPAGVSFESASLRMESPVSEASPWTQILTRWADGVDEASGGAVEIEVFTDAELSRDTVRQFENIQSGTIDGAVVSNQPLTGFDERLNIFSFPFLADTEDAYFELLDGPGKDLWQDSLDTLGVVGLPAATSMQGFRELTTSTVPVRTPDDLDGLTLRVPGLNLYVGLFERMGVNPVSMPFGELAGALQQGVVDGQENPLATIEAAGLHELQDYLTVWHYSTDSLIFAFNKEKWDSLSPATQEMLSAEAVEAMQWHRESIAGLDAEALEGFRSSDAFEEIVEYEDVDVDAFKEAMQPVYDEWRDTLGEDLVDSFVGS